MANPRLAAIGWGLMLLALPGFASLLGTDLPYRDGRISTGGYVGLAETELLRGFAGPVGGVVVLVFLLILGVLLLSGASAGAFADRLAERVRSSWFERRRGEVRTTAGKGGDPRPAKGDRPPDPSHRRQ